MRIDSNAVGTHKIARGAASRLHSVQGRISAEHNARYGSNSALSSLELDASTSPIVSKRTRDWKGSKLKMTTLTS